MRRPFLLLVAMIASVALVAALAWWDQRAESTAAFDELAAEQSTLADAVAAAMADRFPEVAKIAEKQGRPLDPKIDAAALVGDVASIARSGESVILLSAPNGTLIDLAGRIVVRPELVDALSGPATSFVLNRPMAASLGLPERTAIAGLAHVDDGVHGRWGVIVASTARAVRDRELRGRARLLGSVLVAAGLVYLFGSFALRTQRKELDLERRLALAQVQRRADERLSRANRVAMMGTLATGVAHEISTPLGVISGRAEQLAPRVSDDERASKHVRDIAEQTHRIEEVVRGFLHLARGGAPALRRVSPASIVDGATHLVRHRFEQAGVTLEAKSDDPLPALEADARLLEHAVVNLLLNACEACEPGARVILTAKSADDGVRFEVADEGSGIDEDAAARAFEPFFTTKPMGKGTGLGLAITREIVEAHHGTLSLAPRAPKGTRATLILPAVGSAAAVAEAKGSNDAHA